MIPEDPGGPVSPGESGIDGQESPTIDHRAGRSRPFLIGLALFIGLVVISLGTWLVVRDTGTSDYNDEVEANFLAACTEDGGEPVEPVCECLYAQIVEKIPYDRFEEVNDALEAERASGDGDDVPLPEDFDQIRAACVKSDGVVASTTTASTAPASTAPATTASTTTPAT